MEYAIVGSVLSLLLSMKFTAFKAEKLSAANAELVQRLEAAENYAEKHDTEMLKKVMTTVSPIAIAVNKLNNEVGIR